MNSKVIKEMLADGHPVVVFLPRPKARQEDVLDDVLDQLGDTLADSPMERLVKKPWSKNELLALAFLRDNGGRGAMRQFAEKAGRTYMAVRSKASMLGGSRGRIAGAGNLDNEVMGLIKSKPAMAERVGKRVLASIMGTGKVSTTDRRSK